ncbi:hypothetical protein ScPMuIL_005467 [Solemya velum]
MMFAKSFCMLIFVLNVTIFTVGGLCFFIGDRQCELLNGERWMPWRWFESDSQNLCLTRSGKLVYGAKKLGLEIDESFLEGFILSSILLFASMFYAVSVMLADIFNLIRSVFSRVDGFGYLEFDVTEFLRRCRRRRKGKRVSWNSAVEEFHYTPD